MKIKVLLIDNSEVFHTLPIWCRNIDIYAWLNDKYGGYGWKTFDEI